MMGTSRGPGASEGGELLLRKSVSVLVLSGLQHAPGSGMGE